MKTVLGIPVWLLTLWAVSTVLMSAWAYFAYPMSEFKLTLLMSGVGLLVMVVLGTRRKLDKTKQERRSDP